MHASTHACPHRRLPTRVPGQPATCSPAQPATHPAGSPPRPGQPQRRCVVQTFVSLPFELKMFDSTKICVFGSPAAPCPRVYMRACACMCVRMRVPCTCTHEGPWHVCANVRSALARSRCHTPSWRFVAAPWFEYAPCACVCACVRAEVRTF